LYISAILLAVIVLIFLYICPKKEYLVLRDGDNGKLIARYEVEENEEFAVSFIHSVNKSIVKESYEIKQKNIYLTKCLYRAFGAGVATQVEPPQTLEYLSDGSMLISGFDRKIEDLSYIVATVSDHILYINDEEISLGELCGKNRTVRFEIEQRLY